MQKADVLYVGLCANCGHPWEDHLSRALFKKYFKKYQNMDSAWNALRKEHPRFTDCNGFVPKTIATQKQQPEELRA